MKPIIAAAALNEELITPRTRINSTGGIQINQWFFPDWRAGGHGSTDLRRSLAWSVNTYYYYIGGGYENFKGLGVERISEYMKEFQLGAPLGIDLPAESGGFIPTREWKEAFTGENWYIGDTYHLAIGQGDLLVTHCRSQHGHLFCKQWYDLSPNTGPFHKRYTGKYTRTNRNPSLHSE